MSEVQLTEIDIDVFSDECFDVANSITQTKEIIDSMVLSNRWVKGEFEDDNWFVTDLMMSGNYQHFDFTPFNSSTFNKSLPKEFKEMVKCWVVNLIEKYKDVRQTFNPFVQCFKVSKGFNKNELTTLLQYIEYHESINIYKLNMIRSVCNFFDYTDLESGDDFTPSLIELKNKIPSVKPVRQLPSSKYVLSFSYYLEKHFEKLLDDSFKQSKIENEILLVYPLIIWWRLTNIIPMRANEFSSIERDCLIMKDGKHYIQLPRRKQKNTNRIQILDKLLIDSDMYHLIEKYIELTNPYGETATLISFRSIIFASPSNRAAYTREVITRDKNRFKRSQLYSLLKWFYRKLNEEYSYHVEAENHIRPNDTRHFAFVSLMMQGYSPIEIARLGGHQTVQAQYHYSGHTEYWVDCEVFKLMKKVKNSKIVSKETGSIPDEVKLKALENSYNGFKIKMKIGYCKDEEQRCETKKCYFCSHWGISSDEYMQKKNTIRDEILVMKNNVNELAVSLHNLNKQFLYDEFSRRNPEFLTGMKTKANAIQSEIYKLALLCSKLGGGEVTDGEISWT